MIRPKNTAEAFTFQNQKIFPLSVFKFPSFPREKSISN